MNMNENQTMMKNYILIVRTVHGEPDHNITVCLRGSEGQTEQIPLGKSQSYKKAFRNHQSDLFLLVSHIDIGEIYQVEFHVSAQAKSKEWKYNHVLIIDGIRVYQDIISEYSLLPSTKTSSIVNVSEPFAEPQQSIYYALIKTGHDSCSKEGYPKLSLFDNNEQRTEIDLKSSTNFDHALQKYQFDIFQWQDHHIGNIERIRLQLYAANKQTKCQWPIEWVLIIHNGYSFSGRIMLNRTMKIDRYLDIDLEQKSFPIAAEHGDALPIEKPFHNQLSPSYDLYKQSNATGENIGRYYVFIKNMEGTKGDVYIEFHGDRLSASGEQHLFKCENYPDNAFANKHTDLFHVKTLEVGAIHTVTLRLDQTTKEHAITLSSMFIIHNTIMYQFDLKYIILNKEQPKKEFTPLSHLKFHETKTCYYIATHTSDKSLAGNYGNIKVVVTGTKGTIGPLELKESLTNGTDPFENESIDLFHFEEDDIGDPTTMTVTLEPKGLMSHLLNSAKCERMMLLKDGEYNSLWQLVGILKVEEPKTLSLPLHPRSSNKSATPHPTTPVEPIQPKTTNEILPSSVRNSLLVIPKLKSEEKIEPEVIVDDYSMAMIEDHQKRHTFAPSLYQAQQNYRELRRLLRKVNGSMSNEQKTQKRMTNSNRI